MINVPEKSSRPEKEKISEKVVEKLYAEKKEQLEKGEPLLSEREKIIREKLEMEIAKMRSNPQLQDDAQRQAQQIRDLDEKGRLERLLDIAEERGVAFAVGVAQDMKDPYLLDIFHDILARGGLYKKFRK